VVKFACLTGLRPIEACESVRLLNGAVDAPKYYNPSQRCLEHFRFPDIFIRRTKTAYLSIITKEQHAAIGILGCKTSTPTPTTIPTYTSIRFASTYRGLPFHMAYCRKIFASYLRQKGIEPEIVDLLQGRVGQSVLVRRYQSPDNRLKKRVLEAVSELQKQLN